MKIFDSILFNNEIDILELRLRILYDYVDRFIIVESDKTFTGLPKEYNFEKEKEKFIPWLDKIVYIKVKRDPYTNPWQNEEVQRNFMEKGWGNVESNDVILLSDVDEIIRPEAIEFVRNTNFDYYGFCMPAFYFKFNYLDTKDDYHYKIWGQGFRGIKAKPSDLRCTNITANTSAILHHAGWHFSWIGDNEFVKDKLKSFSHTEFNTKEILENLDIDKSIKNGIDHIRPENKTWETVDLDNYFPKEIINNKEKYSKYILPNTGKRVTDYFKKQILEI